MSVKISFETGLTTSTSHARTTVLN